MKIENLNSKESTKTMTSSRDADSATVIRKTTATPATASATSYNSSVDRYDDRPNELFLPYSGDILRGPAKIVLGEFDTRMPS